MGDRSADPIREKCTNSHGCPGRRDCRQHQGVGLDEPYSGVAQRADRALDREGISRPRYVRTLEPGLALIVPIVDRVGAKINMMETVFEVPSQSVITRDNAVVTVEPDTGGLIIALAGIVKLGGSDEVPRSVAGSSGSQSANARLLSCLHRCDGRRSPRKVSLRLRGRARDRSSPGSPSGSLQSP